MFALEEKCPAGIFKKPPTAKKLWTSEEDRLLQSLVHSHGEQWSLIASLMKSRSGKQCRERWHNHLGPNIKKEAWSIEEETTLIKAQAEIGNSWVEIAKRIPGRTENSVKNHWRVIKRKQQSQLKTDLKKNEYHPSSLFQDYIKSSTCKMTNEGMKNILKDAKETPQGLAAANAPLALPEQGNGPHHMEKKKSAVNEAEENNVCNATPELRPEEFPFMEMINEGNDFMFEDLELFFPF